MAEVRWPSQYPIKVLRRVVYCVGVMGRGVALQLRKAFPDNFKAYAAACAREALRPGNMLVFETGLLTKALDGLVP